MQSKHTCWGSHVGPLPTHRGWTQYYHSVTAGALTEPSDLHPGKASGHWDRQPPVRLCALCCLLYFSKEELGHRTVLAGRETSFFCHIQLWHTWGEKVASTTGWRQQKGGRSTWTLETFMQKKWAYLHLCSGEGNRKQGNSFSTAIDSTRSITNIWLSRHWNGWDNKKRMVSLGCQEKLVYLPCWYSSSEDSVHNLPNSSEERQPEPLKGNWKLPSLQLRCPLLPHHDNRHSGDQECERWCLLK